jgi:myo-inositol catabolism protein IolS
VIYRELGKSGVMVSAISMGCWPIVGDAVWGPQDEGEAIAALRAAVDCGVNFFDSAEMYGNGLSEELLRKGLSDVRSAVIIASKAAPPNAAPSDMRAACEGSLRRLGTDYIDVYYMHWPNHAVPFSDTMGAMQQLKAEGKIRVIGLSNFGRLDLPEMLACGHAEVNELPYNLLWRVIETEIMPLCVQEALSITAYMPLMQGLLTGKFHTPADVPDLRARTRHFAPDRPQSRHGEAGAEAETFAAIAKIDEIARGAGLTMTQVALSWPLYQPAVDSVIVGARNPAQVQANAAAAETKLSPDVLSALDSATRALKDRFGANPDMWQNTANSRYR